MEQLRNNNEIMNTGIVSRGNNNYSMQDLLNVVGQNAMTVQNLGNQLGIVTTKVNAIGDDINTIKVEIETLKLNEEVTTDQQESIIHTANKRICKILGNNEIERQKYYRIFVKTLYSDTRHYAGLGSKISRTRKGDFQRVINYIEAWNPSCGCAELRAKADRNAEARLVAKMQGYID